MKTRKISLLAGWIVCLACLILMAGCGFGKKEHINVKDLEFTILGEELLPTELAALIEEKKEDEFRFTYSDKKYLYICIGYGRQKTGGYSIAVNELYLGENAVYVSCELLGPTAEDKKNTTPSHPYIVIKTEFLDETVIFE